MKKWKQQRDSRAFFSLPVAVAKQTWEDERWTGELLLISFQFELSNLQESRCTGFFVHRKTNSCLVEFTAFWRTTNQDTLMITCNNSYKMAKLYDIVWLSQKGMTCIVFFSLLNMENGGMVKFRFSLYRYVIVKLCSCTNITTSQESELN